MKIENSPRGGQVSFRRSQLFPLGLFNEWTVANDLFTHSIHFYLTPAARNVWQKSGRWSTGERSASTLIVTAKWLFTLINWINLIEKLLELELGTLAHHRGTREGFFCRSSRLIESWEWKLLTSLGLFAFISPRAEAIIVIASLTCWWHSLDVIRRDQRKRS
jgi:hypothetical protein